MRSCDTACTDMLPEHHQEIGADQYVLIAPCCSHVRGNIYVVLRVYLCSVGAGQRNHWI